MLLKKASLCQSVSFVTLVMDLGSIVLMCLLVSASLNVILLCSLCCLLRKPGITRKSENRGEDNSPSPRNVKKYQKHDAKIKQCSKPLLDREDEITIVVKKTARCSTSPRAGTFLKIGQLRQRHTLLARLASAGSGCISSCARFKDLLSCYMAGL